MPPGTSNRSEVQGFKVQRFRVQGSKVQGSGLVKGNKTNNPEPVNVYRDNKEALTHEAGQKQGDLGEDDQDDITDNQGPQ